MKMLELRTFGNELVAIRLAELINENGISPSKIGKLVASFNFTLKELKKIDTRLSLNIAKHYLVSYKKTAMTYDSKINTYLCNLLNAKYKFWLFEQDGLTPHKNRIK